MKKVVNISLGGRGFAMDEDAYIRLTAYFEHFKTHFRNGTPDLRSSEEEVMSDLESRMAELFDRETLSSPARVIDLAMVERITGQLGMPDGAPEEKGTDAGPEPKEGEHFGTFGRPTGADFSYEGEHGPARRRFFRDRENKAIGGVCAGMGALFNVDVTIIRIIFLVFLFGWGSGLLVYLILWMVVPAAKTSADFCQMHGLEPTAENMAKFTIKREK